VSFEVKIKQLEEIVKKLETPEMGIDEGVKFFDQGVKISKECYDILHATKGQVSIIKKELNEVVEKPFKE